MNYPRSDVCFEFNYLEDTFVPKWFQTEFKAEVSRIEQERKEEQEQIEYQIKRGIIKRKTMSIELKDNQQLKELNLTVTKPMITRIKGHDLFGNDPCGNHELLKDCKDCLLKLKIINKQ